MIDVSNRVLSNVKVYIANICSTVTSDSSNTPASFPVTSVEQIDNPDRAQDLENSENAVNSVVEIQAYSNKSLSEAKKIAGECCDAMRIMGFIRTYGPVKISNASDTNIYRVVSRFNRIVSSVDEIKKL